MLSVKIQCGCGQRYAFDVEPAGGRIATPVACPACGADGVAAANDFIARSLAAQPQATPAAWPAVSPITTAKASFRPLIKHKGTVLRSALISAVLFTLVTCGTFKEQGTLNKSGILVLINAFLFGAVSTGIVALWSRRSQAQWPWWRVILTTVGCYLLIAITVVVVITMIMTLLR